MKNNKFNKLFEWLNVADFVRQVFIVVCGIGITFWVGSIVEENKINSSISTSLRLVAEEMKLNRNSIESVANHLDKSIKGYDFLGSSVDTIDRVNADTLSHYLGTVASQYPLSLSRHALDILQSSAHYEQIDNRLFIYLAMLYQMNEMLNLEYVKYYAASQAMTDNFFRYSRDFDGDDVYAAFKAFSRDETFELRCLGMSFGPAMVAGFKRHNEDISRAIKLVDSLCAIGDFREIDIESYLAN